jgi:hypothetical protein
MFYHKSSMYYHVMMNMALWHFYDDNVLLIENTTFTNFGAKFITALFNDNT